jgi:hypothetical protein
LNYVRSFSKKSREGGNGEDGSEEASPQPLFSRRGNWETEAKRPTLNFVCSFQRTPKGKEMEKIAAEDLTPTPLSRRGNWETEAKIMFF